MKLRLSVRTKFDPEGETFPDEFVSMTETQARMQKCIDAWVTDRHNDAIEFKIMKVEG